MGCCLSTVSVTICEEKDNKISRDMMVIRNNLLTKAISNAQERRRKSIATTNLDCEEATREAEAESKANAEKELYNAMRVANQVAKCKANAQ